MARPGKATTWRKAGLVLLCLTVMAWLPAGSHQLLSGWGPSACLAQEAADSESNSEIIYIGSMAGNSFTGCVNILGNTVTETGALYSATLKDSFQGFVGISQVNQGAGSLAAQGNWVGVAAADDAEVIGLSLSYKSKLQDNALTTAGTTYQASIEGSSFAGGAGIALVNQGAGHMNSQFNAFSLTIGKQGAVNLSDIELGSVSINNTVTNDPEAPNTHSAKLDLDNGAFKDYTGLWSANQVAGSLSQATTVFNVNVNTVP
jgi:hypothetical protein